MNSAQTPNNFSLNMLSVSLSLSLCLFVSEGPFFSQHAFPSKFSHQLKMIFGGFFHFSVLVSSVEFWSHFLYLPVNLATRYSLWEINICLSIWLWLSFSLFLSFGLFVFPSFGLVAFLFFSLSTYS